MANFWVSPRSPTLNICFVVSTNTLSSTDVEYRTRQALILLGIIDPPTSEVTDQERKPKVEVEVEVKVEGSRKRKVVKVEGKNSNPKPKSKKLKAVSVHKVDDDEDEPEIIDLT